MVQHLGETEWQLYFYSARACSSGRETLAEAASLEATIRAIDEEAPVIRVPCKAREGAHVGAVMGSCRVGEEVGVEALLPETSPVGSLLAHVRGQELNLSWLNAISDGPDGIVIGGVHHCGWLGASHHDGVAGDLRGQAWMNRAMPFQ